MANDLVEDRGEVSKNPGAFFKLNPAQPLMVAGIERKSFLSGPKGGKKIVAKARANDGICTTADASKKIN